MKWNPLSQRLSQILLPCILAFLMFANFSIVIDGQDSDFSIFGIQLTIEPQKAMAAPDYCYAVFVQGPCANPNCSHGGCLYHCTQPSEQPSCNCGELGLCWCC